MGRAIKLSSLHNGHLQKFVNQRTLQCMKKGIIHSVVGKILVIQLKMNTLDGRERLLGHLQINQCLRKEINPFIVYNFLLLNPGLSGAKTLPLPRVTGHSTLCSACCRLDPSNPSHGADPGAGSINLANPDHALHRGFPPQGKSPLGSANGERM